MTESMHVPSIMHKTIQILTNFFMHSMPMHIKVYFLALLNIKKIIYFDYKHQLHDENLTQC